MVLNGRFKGGYITRRYGDPANSVHAVQLELSEATYMDERPPYGLREKLAHELRPQLRTLLELFLLMAGKADRARKLSSHFSVRRATSPFTYGA